MKKNLPDGVWPTMVTPFTDSNEIDYSALEEMVEWYIKNKVNGLFAVCQSSEMFYLSFEEKINLARFVKEKAGGRVPVIASGHISDSIADQAYEMNAMAETGVDAVVLTTNRLALQNDRDDLWKSNLIKLLKQIPGNVPLGFYECPYPYKRLISPELLNFCASTGRFLFLKDTSCSIENIKAKLDAVKGSELKIYNAHTTTLLESLKAGAAGYSGVMANFHPGLYAWLAENWRKKPEDAGRLLSFLSVSSQIENQLYPVNAKYNLQLEGLKIGINTRSKDHKRFSPAYRLEVEHLADLANYFAKEFSQFDILSY